jgi:hypothetical protein
MMWRGSMIGHRKWEPVIVQSRQTRSETIAYVQGYILAMEDVLKDIVDDDVLIDKVEESIRQARSTLRALNETS